MATKKAASGYEAGKKVKVLMTATDQQLIRDIDNGITMLLDGEHLKGLDREIAALRQDVDRLADSVSAIAKAVGCELPAQKNKRASGRRGPGSKPNDGLGRPGLN